MPAAAEVIGIDLQGLVAVADRFGKLVGGEVGDRPLVPGFGKPGGFVEQFGRLPDGLLIAFGGVESNDDRKFPPLVLVTGASNIADAILAEHANRTVLVLQCSAEGMVGCVIACKTQPPGPQPF